jgi:hypothetical protein
VNPTSVQIWERIHSAGLATSDECRQWAMSIAQAGGQQSLLDSGKLVTELIRSGRITSFQGNVLFRHLPIPLIVGSYKLTRSLESDLGKDWFEAIEVGRAESTLLWLQLLTQSKLKSNSNRTNPPSLRWAQQHVALTHPSLDRWVYAGVADSNLIAVARAIPGQSIAAMLTERRLGWDESSAMIEQIASGLLKLHGSGMVHGDLNMHLAGRRCLCTAPQSFVLASQSIWSKWPGPSAHRRATFSGLRSSRIDAAFNPTFHSNGSLCIGLPVAPSVGGRSPFRSTSPGRVER